MSEESPLISVIVPIYNVDKYVRKCLDSLKNQTMKQIEIICIDDGSTDSSGEIAEEYKNGVEWPIFRVFHTENRGLSAARNRGIDEAKSEWIMFVDSDDWVDKDFCRIPYEAAIENSADLVIFDHYITNQIGTLRRKKIDKILSGFTKAECVIRNSVAWNKLYKKSLLEDIRYPEGHVFEDVATTHKIIHRSKRIFCCDEGLYYYRNRRGSISKNTLNRTDEYIATIQRYKDLIELQYANKKDKIQLLVLR